MDKLTDNGFIEISRERITVKVLNTAHSTQWMDARAREVDPAARLSVTANNYDERADWQTPMIVRHYSR